MSVLPSAFTRLLAIRCSAQLFSRPWCRSFLFSKPFLYSDFRFIMASSSTPEKYRSPPQAPPLFNGTKDSVLGDCRALIAAQRAVLDNIAATVTPETATFSNTMEALARDEDQAKLSSDILTFYQYVSSDASLRESSSEADRLLTEFNIESMMREDIFKLVDAVYQKRAVLSLDAESLRLLEKWRKGYITYGLGIPAGSQRDRFKQLKTRLSNIAIEFSKNLNEENGCLWLTPEELQGVPEDVVSSLDKGSSENEGKLRLTFKYPHLLPTLKFAVNPDVRRRLLIADSNKVRIPAPCSTSAQR